VLIIAALIYAGLCAFFYLAQRSFIYFPTPETQTTAASPLRLRVDDAELKIWQVARAGQNALIYFGGNAQDVSGQIAPLAAALPDYSLYIANYRGYGGSTGTPSESALFRDAVALFDLVRKDHARVAVIGRSLGSGVAAYLATERPIDQLVLVTPYDSIKSIAQSHYRLLPVSWLLRDKFDSLSRVPKITAPTLAVIAELDDVVERAHSDALVAAFPAAQIKIRVLPGEAHNFAADLPEYLGAIRSFL
jgi:hypothetical protein